MPVKQLSDGNPDGTVLGQSPCDLISFYNVTPVPQRSGAAQAAVPPQRPRTARPMASARPRRRRSSRS